MIDTVWGWTRPRSVQAVQHSVSISWIWWLAKLSEMIFRKLDDIDDLNPTFFDFNRFVFCILCGYKKNKYKAGHMFVRLKKIAWCVILYSWPFNWNWFSLIHILTNIVKLNFIWQILLSWTVYLFCTSLQIQGKMQIIYILSSILASFQKGLF